MEDIVINTSECDIIVNLNGVMLNGLTGYIRKASLNILPKREGVLIFIPHLFPDEYIQLLKNLDHVSK